MIKLKQLIKESLKDMVFSKSIKPKHKKRMGIKNKLFPSNPKLTITPPPANDSNETRTELFKLLAYNDGVIDRKMVEEYDDMTKPFMELIEKHNVDVTKDDLQQIIDEGAKFSLKIKYKYNRPRPYQIAEHYGIEDFKRHKLDTAKTPSYPSGHSTQAYLLAIKLATKYPSIASELYELGENISYSRVLGKVHYPSDYQYGKILGDSLARSL